MATDALSIPYDIPWRRVAWSRDMLDVQRGGPLPPKWKSSLTVYAYAAPLAETADDYPDARIVYLKVSCSLTGWAESESYLAGDPRPSDEWTQNGWEAIHTGQQASQYWACVGAFVQIGIFPRPESGTGVDDYPYVMDFEPKKRELYEAVALSRERLSSSANRVATGKSQTDARGTEDTSSTSAGFNVAGIGASVSGSERQSWNHQDVTNRSEDASVERRETQGRTTQLAQMYQLFNGYHLGTNRALFVVLPRPHLAQDDTDDGTRSQVLSNLINGERRLEGIQEMFLVVHVPRTLTGFAVDAWLDTSHKSDFRTQEFASDAVLTRRYVTGSADFAGDGFTVLPSPAVPPRPTVEIVGETTVFARQRFAGLTPAEYARSAKGRHVDAVDHLNLLHAESTKALQAFQMSGNYAARDYRASDVFRARALAPLATTTVSVQRLVDLGYIKASEGQALAALHVDTSGDLFREDATAALVLDVRKRLLDALVAQIVPKT